jgi:hypothetical protein
MARRQWHVYIGCFFAPLLIYFSLSGAWQMFGLHDLPKDHPPTAVNRILHELSNPHRDAVLPGRNRRQASPSVLFRVMTLFMAMGFVITAMLGIQMGWQVRHRRKVVAWCLVAGIMIPIFLLLLT